MIHNTKLNNEQNTSCVCQENGNSYGWCPNSFQLKINKTHSEYNYLQTNFNPKTFAFWGLFEIAEWKNFFQKTIKLKRHICISKFS